MSELTADFSFAYLKELFLSSMMNWVSSTEQGSMEETMISQVSVLHEQMMSSPASRQESEAQLELPATMTRQVTRARSSL